MSSVNHSVYDTISPSRHIVHVGSDQTMPQRGLSPLTVPGGLFRATTLRATSPPPRFPSVPTTHPTPRGGAASPRNASAAARGSSSSGDGFGSDGKVRRATFTDLRFSPAQRAKGTYGAGYCTLGRGLMRDLHDMEDVQATGYAPRQLPELRTTQMLRAQTVPRYTLTPEDYTRVFVDLHRLHPAGARSGTPTHHGHHGPTPELLASESSSTLSQYGRFDPTRQVVKRAGSVMSLASSGSRVFEELSPRGGHGRSLSPPRMMSHETAPLLTFKQLLQAKKPKLYT